MVELKQEPQKLTAFLSGELDHHHAKEIREAIDFAVREQYPPVLILDFKQVSFMDSSGIGLIMGRSRLLEEYGGVLEIHNPEGIADCRCGQACSHPQYKPEGAPEACTKAPCDSCTGNAGDHGAAAGDCTGKRERNGTRTCIRSMN